MIKPDPNCKTCDGTGTFESGHNGDIHDCGCGAVPDEIHNLLVRIKAREQSLARIRQEIEELTKKLFDSCSHPHEATVEGDYTEWFRPFRVCRICGYAEQGWNVGYWKLNAPYGTVPTLSREEAWKFVRKHFSQDELWEMRKAAA